MISKPCTKPSSLSSYDWFGNTHITAVRSFCTFSGRLIVLYLSQIRLEPARFLLLLCFLSGPSGITLNTPFCTIGRARTSTIVTPSL
ncbi:hypothetical protein BDZ85DRAFT_270856 [Elsinoe ampelina]|uniref:Uncharacterized protein n=1 Tax=Elsinoe ampelina TaxID=302913 RepID=A0A6A6FY37_9PEZI|nr:hypothetical protein BDZ85DRAFT_270856 [Elsinoe ampelina]